MCYEQAFLLFKTKKCIILLFLKTPERRLLLTFTLFEKGLADFVKHY